MGASRGNPNHLALYLSDRSANGATYVVYKSVTGPQIIPVHVMIVGLATGGNFLNGYRRGGGQSEFGVSKCM